MPILQLEERNIEAFWPAIKRAVDRSLRVPATDREKFSLNVLKNLYTGLHQAWIVFDWVDGEKETHAIMVTSVNENPLTEVRFLYVSAIYGYRELTEELVRDLDSGLMAFAKSQECSFIKCETNHDRIRYFLNLIEYEIESTNYIKEVI